MALTRVRRAAESLLYSVHHHISSAAAACAAGPVQSSLPSALSALDSLEGPPTYLNPEATRPLASSAYHGRLVRAGAASGLS